MPYRDPEQAKSYSRAFQKKKRLCLAKERWSQRTARLASRPPVLDVDAAWAAGHFEGEGTVTLVRGGRVMHVRPLVSLSSTDRVAVDFFHALWPGNRRSFIPKSGSGNNRMAHVWTLNSGERVQAFLLDILPQLRTARVRRKALLVLEDIEDRGLYQQQLEVKVRSERRRELMSKLNAKGKATLESAG